MGTLYPFNVFSLLPVFLYVLCVYTSLLDSLRPRVLDLDWGVLSANDHTEEEEGGKEEEKG